MVRERKISVYKDLKTGFFCKFFLIIGSILLVIFAVQKLVSTQLFDENQMGVILAFAILFLGLGMLIYFISLQFAKLAKIAEEIEKQDLGSE